MRYMLLVALVLSSVWPSGADSKVAQSQSSAGDRELQDPSETPTAEAFWDNLFGSACSDYERNGWCANGQFSVSGEPMGAPSATAHQKCADLGDGDCARLYNYPARSCTVCGAVVSPSVTVPSFRTTTPAPPSAPVTTSSTPPPPPDSGPTIRCAGPGSASCWRIRALQTAPEGWGWDVADIEFYRDRACTQRVATAVPISSAHENNERYSPMSAFDGEGYTLWGGRKDGDGVLWVGAELIEKDRVSCIRFRQVADPPEDQGRFRSREGNCEIDSRGCATSPNFPGQHENGESCEVSGPQEAMAVTSFQTESNYDYMTLNGRIYEGSNGPDGVVLNGRIRWQTDGSVVTNGWRICSRRGWPQTVETDAALRVDNFGVNGWSEMPWTLQGSLSDGWTTLLVNGPEGQGGDYPASDGCPIGMQPAEIMQSESCAATIQPTAAPSQGTRANSFALEPGTTVAVLSMLVFVRAAR